METSIRKMPRFRTVTSPFAARQVRRKASAFTAHLGRAKQAATSQLVL